MSWTERYRGSPLGVVQNPHADRDNDLVRVNYAKPLGHAAHRPLSAEAS